MGEYHYRVNGNSAQDGWMDGVISRLRMRWRAEKPLCVGDNKSGGLYPLGQQQNYDKWAMKEFFWRRVWPSESENSRVGRREDQQVTNVVPPEC